MTGVSTMAVLSFNNMGRQSPHQQSGPNNGKSVGACAESEVTDAQKFHSVIFSICSSSEGSNVQEREEGRITMCHAQQAMCSVQEQAQKVAFVTSSSVSLPQSQAYNSHRHQLVGDVCTMSPSFSTSKLSKARGQRKSMAMREGSPSPVGPVSQVTVNAVLDNWNTFDEIHWNSSIEIVNASNKLVLPKSTGRETIIDTQNETKFNPFNLIDKSALNEKLLLRQSKLERKVQHQKVTPGEDILTVRNEAVNLEFSRTIGHPNHLQVLRCGTTRKKSTKEAKKQDPTGPAHNSKRGGLSVPYLPGVSSARSILEIILEAQLNKTRGTLNNAAEDCQKKTGHDGTSYRFSNKTNCSSNGKPSKKVRGINGPLFKSSVHDDDCELIAQNVLPSPDLVKLRDSIYGDGKKPRSHLIRDKFASLQTNRGSSKLTSRRNTGSDRQEATLHAPESSSASRQLNHNNSLHRDIDGYSPDLISTRECRINRDANSVLDIKTPEVARLMPRLYDENRTARNERSSRRRATSQAPTMGSEAEVSSSLRRIPTGQVSPPQGFRSPCRRTSIDASPTFRFGAQSPTFRFGAQSRSLVNALSSWQSPLERTVLDPPVFQSSPRHREYRGVVVAKCKRSKKSQHCRK